MDVAQIVELFEGTDVKVESYSGRGMFGSTCLGIVGSWRECQRALSDTIIQIADDVADNALNVENEDEELRKIDQQRSDMATWIKKLLDFTTDSMGLDIVMYWKDIKYEEKMDDDQEEDDGEG